MYRPPQPYIRGGRRFVVGYTSIEQIDQALRNQLRFLELLRSAREHVAPELQGVCLTVTDSVGSDPVFDALLDARLRLAKRSAQLAQANAALRRIGSRTSVQEPSTHPNL